MIRPLITLALSAALLPAQYHTLSKERMIDLTRQNPFPRFEDGRPNVPDALLEKVRGLTVEEAWGFLREKQYPNQYEGGWRILHPEKKLVGRAVTAQFMPLRPDLNDLVVGDLKRRNYTSGAHQWVIDQLQPGDVLVVDLFGKEDGGSVVGDNLATAIKSATVNGGLVVDGAIRDLEGIQPIDMGIYFRHAHPSAIGAVTLTGYNIPVRIGNTTVLPGDVVFGDRTGLYFLPTQFVQGIVDRAEETHIHDEWTKGKFTTGRYRSSDLYPRPKDPALQKEYEEYKRRRLGK
ncbi:MAG: dimethylmenaquinone methyltransferase [Acidobacteria bacterium]|nr:dimethylmenaquinone methyltransferase [Acidobacteriota bacterium]